MSSQVEVVSKNVAEIEALLVNAQDQLAAMLPRHISPDRMIAVALELVRGDSGLQKCLTSPEGRISIVQGVLEASQLGLLLARNLGHAYLVPFKNGALSEKYKKDVALAQFMIGYRGFAHLAKQGNGQVAHVFSRIVFPDEPFDISEGTARTLLHKPNLEGGKIAVAEDGSLSGFLGAYAMVIFKDGSGIPADFEWMPLSEIERCRRSSKARREDSPWRQWPEEMIKKTPIRRLGKRMELTPEITAAIVRDEYREFGYENHQQEEPRRMPMPRRKSEVVIATPYLEKQQEQQSTAKVEQAPSSESVGPEGGPPELNYRADTSPLCSKCGGDTRFVDAGSTKQGKKYPAFWGCKDRDCKGGGVNAKDWHDKHWKSQEAVANPQIKETSDPQIDKLQARVQELRGQTGDGVFYDALKAYHVADIRRATALDLMNIIEYLEASLVGN